MYIIKIDRIKEKEDTTKGTGYTLSSASLLEDTTTLLEFYTLEPAGPDTTTPGQDKRIPEGIYKVSWEPSTTTGHKIKGKLPLLYNDVVSKARKIRIHIGNKTTETEGCIMPGLGVDFDLGLVTNSKKALTQILDIIFEKEVEVHITNKV